MSATDLSPMAWVLLAVGAAAVGFAKTAVGGAGALAVVAFAAAVPARDSTGALLPLLCVWFLAIADDMLMRRSFGAILLAMVAIQAWTRRVHAVPTEGRRSTRPTLAVVMGVTAGFATMTANAAGPVTTLYLLAAGLPMLEFLGTAAWFYLLVNAAKLPFSAGLDLISRDSLLVDAMLVPALGLGALVGVLLVRRIDQAQFERAALVLAGLAAAALLV